MVPTIIWAMKRSAIPIRLVPDDRLPGRFRAIGEREDIGQGLQALWQVGHREVDPAEQQTR